MEKFPVIMAEFEFHEIKSEIEEPFDDVAENQRNTIDTKSEISSEDNEFQRPNNHSEFSTAITQLTEAIPSLSRCRLCGMPDNNMIDIFGFDETSKNILPMINLCLPIMVQETDTLPKQVCWSCLEELERCCRFHRTVMEAEKQLLAFEKTERDREPFPPYGRQHRATGETLKRTSDMKMSNDDPTSSPERAPTEDTILKRNVLLSTLRPCSVVLYTAEIRHNNNFTAKKNGKSSNNSRHRNPDSITEAFDFGTTTASGVVQQGSCDLEVTRGTHSSSVVDDMQAEKPENVKMKMIRLYL